MKIQLLSDLHLEAHPQFTPEPAPAADVLVLAGDIGSYQEGGLLADTSFGLERFSPLPQFAGWPVPVLFSWSARASKSLQSVVPTKRTPSSTSVSRSSHAMPSWSQTVRNR